MIVTKISNEEVHLNNPFIYTFNDVHKNTRLLSLFPLDRSIVLEAVDILVNAGMAKYKIKDHNNPYKSTICITENGLKAFKNATYRKAVAKRMLKAVKGIKSLSSK